MVTPSRKKALGGSSPPPSATPPVDRTRRRSNSPSQLSPPPTVRTRSPPPAPKKRKQDKPSQVIRSLNLDDSVLIASTLDDLDLIRSGYAYRFYSETDVPWDLIDHVELSAFRSQLSNLIPSPEIKPRLNEALQFLKSQLEEKNQLHGVPIKLKGAAQDLSIKLINGSNVDSDTHLLLKKTGDLLTFYKNIPPPLFTNIPKRELVILQAAYDLASDIDMINHTISTEIKHPYVENSSVSSRSNSISSSKLNSANSYIGKDYKPKPVEQTLSPLSKKTYKELIDGLTASCIHYHDLITLKEFRKMPKKHLKLIVKLGSEPGKQRCYYVRNIYDKWRTDIQSNKPFTDPMRNPVTQEEQEDIMKKIRYLDINARNLLSKADKNVMDFLQMKFTPYYFSAEINGEIRTFSMLKLSVHIVMKGFEAELPILHEAFIPEGVEYEHTHSTDLTSSTLQSNINELFHKGMLLKNKKFPFECCSINLNRSPEYWYDPNSPCVINLTKFKNLANKVSDLLRHGAEPSGTTGSPSGSQ